MNRNSRRLAILALAVAPIASVLPGGNAVASGAGAAVVVGTANLPEFPCGTPAPPQDIWCDKIGTFDSTLAPGADTGGGLITRVTASFEYLEACTAGEPLSGKARGTITAWHGATADPGRPFTWTRVGLVAVIQGGVTGAAVFVPSPLPACGSSTSVSATVAGVGVFAS